MSIENIVDVEISRSTSSVPRTGFSVIMIMGTNKGFTGVTKSFANLAAVLVDFNTTSLEYLAAQDIFSQSPRPRSILISRRATSDTSIVTVATAVDDTIYTCTLEGTVYSIDSGTSATVASIALALVTAINLGSGAVSATDNADGTYDLVADVAGVAYSLNTDIRQTIAYTTSQSVALDLAAITEDSDDWYGLILTSRLEADILAAAAYIETVKKIFLLTDSDADTVDTTDAADTATIAAQIKALAYARTCVGYASLAATEYNDAAILGTVLPLDPGAYTADFKVLTGNTPDDISTTQRTNALAKYVNIYHTVGGRNITEGVKVAADEYLDTIIFVDWLQARITEEIYNLLVTQPKIPFNDAGIASVEAAIKGVLEDGITAGGINPGGYTISVPKSADISATDKANRELKGITFTATITGAIHFVEVRGNVTV